MSYDVKVLKTKDDCDLAIELAQERKEELEFDLTLNGKGLSDKQKTTDAAGARLIEVNAQITGTTSAIASLPEGKTKKGLVSKLRRLNDQKDNLSDRLTNTGSYGLLDSALNLQLIQLQINEIESYITLVTNHKATL